MEQSTTIKEGAISFWDSFVSILWEHIFTWDNFERIFCSLIFLFVLLILLRPNIKISPGIAKWDFDKKTQGPEYLIKFINKSLFPAYEVRVDILKYEPMVVDGGTNYRMSKIGSRIRHYPQVARFRRFDKKDAYYAVCMVTNEDLEAVLKDNCKIIVQITAKHGLSGLTSTFTKEYTGISMVKQGKGFKFGNSFAIV